MNSHQIDHSASTQTIPADDLLSQIEAMTLDDDTDQVWSMPILLLDKPDDYPVQPRCHSRMLSPPDRLRVALHRDTLGVYAILEPEETRPESLWRVVDYVRMNRATATSQDAAQYRVAVQ
jgi:hypothetical protein